MIKIIGIRFKPAGKIYHFNCGAYVLKIGDKVLVETEHGLGYGIVTTPAVSIDPDECRQSLKKIYRPITDEDVKQLEANTITENHAYEFCRESIVTLGLEMNLFAVESNFEGSKLTFFFTAEGRVDFRKLVKMLVKQFRSKIEMRQVGIRNQAKMCGGIGRCGRQLCCSCFLTKFDPVTIKMAKKQGLSLNPTKISGVCGRLMCCLTFESGYYDKKKDIHNKLKDISEEQVQEKTNST